MRRSYGDCPPREEQVRLEEQRLDVQKASTVVEPPRAFETYETVDFGQGHKRGGTQEHRRKRLRVLERPPHRSELSPADWANDWEWYKKHWGVSRTPTAGR